MINIKQIIKIGAVYVLSFFVHVCCTDSAQDKTTIFEQYIATAKTQMQQVHGYNPNIQVVGKSSNYPERVIVFVHGWGDNGDQGKARSKKLRKLEIKEPMICFDFFDARRISTNLIRKVTQTTIGQKPDILVLASMLKILHEGGVKAVDLMSHSRGGAVAISLIGMLADQNGKYDEDLQKIGIDGMQRDALLKMIERGSLLLEDPCVDVSAALKRGPEALCEFVLGNQRAELLVKKCVQPTVAFTEKKVLPKIMSYNPRHPKPIDFAPIFRNVSIPTIIHIQKRDTTVCNKRIIEFFKLLYSYNPKLIYFVASNAKQAHRGKSVALFEVLSAFRAQYGGSYNQFEALKGKEKLQAAQPATDQSIDEFVQKTIDNAKNS